MVPILIVVALLLIVLLVPARRRCRGLGQLQVHVGLVAAHRRPDLPPQGVLAELGPGAAREDRGPQRQLRALLPQGLPHNVREPRDLRRIGVVRLRQPDAELVVVPLGLRQQLPQLAVCRQDLAEAGVQEVEDNLQRPPLHEVAANEPNPPLPQVLRDARKAEAGHVHEAEAWQGRVSGVHVEEIHGLRLAGSLRGWRQCHATQQHVHERGLSHVTPSGEHDLRRALLGRVGEVPDLPQEADALDNIDADGLIGVVVLRNAERLHPLQDLE
mmetsp:Transcript_25438/g.64678  ORF Transcript_25438/g.64678 Transcript_25438/m.64678 type:complete len:271 (-) Transcript_25438:1049-1861(-)